jgi:hypothetical protein
MALALRSARFTTDHGTLEVRECADCTQVQILVESGPPLGADTHVLTLTAEEWGQLTRLPYVDRSERERREQTPDNVLETFLLMDEHTSFEIRERRDGRSVLIVVSTVDPDEAAAFIELTAEQWRYLCSLDYVREPGRDAPPPSQVRRQATETIH